MSTETVTREILGVMFLLALVAGNVLMLFHVRSELCTAVMTPDQLGRQLSRLESFIATNKGPNFAKVCE
jgi:hypothetical protein